jgi:hypothetical protein
LSGGTTSGQLTSNGEVNIFNETVVHGRLKLRPGAAVERGLGIALDAQTSVPTDPIATFSNTAANPEQVPGVQSLIANASDAGFATNRKLVTSAGSSSVVTHLPTRSGHKVVTAPLVEEQVQISGSSRLSFGRARVALGDALSDLVLHGEQITYRVLVTPSGQCAGLAVVERSAAGFLVEELGGGSSDVEFDRLVIVACYTVRDAPRQRR